ncbi:MAG: hypothetical protein FJ095_06980 [Deltaproteobacteria bacterium]|nr:hypothetical protein [Deltaproteobacteria bacterium]
MKLSERIGDALRTPAQRTVVYVLAFGLGSLAVSLLLSWAATSLAERALPSSTSTPKDLASAATSGRPLALPAASARLPGSRALSKTGGSKAGADRGNDSPSDAGD